MRIIETLKYACAWLACLGVLSPAATFGAAPAVESAHQAAQLVKDVELSTTGALQGRVVDPQGNGMGGAVVTLMQNGKQVAQTISAASGAFEIGDLAGGSFQIVSGNTISNCRAWTATTAPPAATQGVLLILPQSVVRGQQAASPPYYGQGQVQPSPAQGQAMQPYPAQGQAMQPYPAQGQMMPGQDQAVQGQPMYPPAGEVAYGEPAYPAGPAYGAPAPIAGRGGYGFLTSPWLIGGVVAAAIAIPLSLDDDDDAS